jgi:organic radical activating enzyme
MDDNLNKCKINPSFFDRYFVKNGINAYAAQILQFMLWRRGKFLNPVNKDTYINKLISEELINFYEKNELNIPMLQFALTTKCTLSCRDCNALIPNFKSSKHFEYVFSDFKYDLDKILTVVNKIRRFILLGGEPLLNKDFPAILEYCAQKDKIDSIEIITNGTLIPSAELLKVLRRVNDKVYIHFSNYSKNKELNNVLKYEQISAMLKAHGIKYQMANDLQWNREDRDLTDRDYPIEVLKKMYGDCWFKGCLQVMNGKICTCPRASATTELIPDSIPVADYIDIRSNQNLYRSFVDFFSRDYVAACRYCVRTGENVLPALQS